MTNLQPGDTGPTDDVAAHGIQSGRLANDVDDDVEGHKRNGITEDTDTTDVEGHLASNRFAPATDDEEVEGHKRNG